MSLSSYVNTIAHSSIFKGIIMGAILANTFTFAISSSLKATEKTILYLDILDGMDSCFLALYCFEFVVKLHTFGRTYWFNGFNCFDFAVLTCSLLQLVLSQTGAKNLGVIKVMRSLRALRPLRSVSLVGGLQVVVTALIATLSGSFLHIILLLCLLMFVYGIMAYYVYGYDSTTVLGDEYWGSFGQSYLSLFVMMTAEGWTDIMKSINSVANFSLGSYFFLISFLFVAHFIFGNLFVAVVIEQIDRATAGYEKRMETKKSTVILKKKQKAQASQENEIKGIINQMISGDFKSFPRAVLDKYKHVRTDEFLIKSEIKCNALWVDTLSFEFSKLCRSNWCLRAFHREMVGVLGELLSNMDQSVQIQLIEQAAEEKRLFSAKRKMTIFRRLSQRTMSFLATHRRPSRHLVGNSVSGATGAANTTIMEEDHEYTGMSCLSCFYMLPECRCIFPEIEELDIEEEAQELLEDEQNPRNERLYSSNTIKWMGGAPSNNLRTSVVSNARSSKGYLDTPDKDKIDELVHKVVGFK